MKKFDTLVKHILLNESPSLEDRELPIDLNKIEINRECLEMCLVKGEQLSNFEKWKVYEVKNGSYAYFCFVAGDSVDAYTQFFINGQVVYSQTVTQKKSDYTKGLIRRAFLNYFSEKFNSIILDRIANNYGKNFFKKLLREAIEKNYKVVVLLDNIRKEIEYDENDYEIYWRRLITSSEQYTDESDILFKIYFK